MLDWTIIRSEIIKLLDNKAWDDGSLGPILVRLAWHSAGTYSKGDGVGGPNGATMRFHPESNDPANKGLNIARAFLEPIKSKYPELSYADLYTFGGVVAIEAMKGPTIPWRSGRTDAPRPIPPNGRLPDASQGGDHLRSVFYRMGFNDREIVALSGAHCLGRCHVERSGYDGPWTYTPTKFTNAYFSLLVNVQWKKRVWEGPEQYQDEAGDLMMLPSDIALIKDSVFAPIVKEYAADRDLFFKDFAAVFSKLLELGFSPTKM